VKKAGIAILVLGAALLFAITSGRLLVINDPQPADVIVVLAGETSQRPARALELLSDHYAPRMLLNVPVNATIYNTTTLELAYNYVQQLPQRGSISICPITGLSTKTEAHNVAACLKRWNIHSVLLVTSDYHTRRALSIFEHEFPGVRCSAASASDSQQFGTRWWQHRQWAKLNFDEWTRFVWWEGVDRWL
jgi:uncharacterized SAM-binding protein YcdF (DUF218 family)